MMNLFYSVSKNKLESNDYLRKICIKNRKNEINKILNIKITSDWVFIFGFNGCFYNLIFWCDGCILLAEACFFGCKEKLFLFMYRLIMSDSTWERVIEIASKNRWERAKTRERAKVWKKATITKKLVLFKVREKNYRKSLNLKTAQYE